MPHDLSLVPCYLNQEVKDCTKKPGEGVSLLEQFLVEPKVSIVDVLEEPVVKELELLNKQLINRKRQSSRKRRDL